jgi:hypothetical protein
MRTMLVTLSVAAGKALLMGLLVVANGSAAPINGAALLPAAGATPLLGNANYYFRRHGRVCYRKCYHEFIIGRRVCRTYC